MSLDVFQESLRRSYNGALTLMEHALRDTPDELWEAPLWNEDEPGGAAIWNVAYHALWYLDYDIAGGFTRWAPPEPFGEQDGGRVLTRVFTRGELLAYVAYCRARVLDTVASLTDELAATPLPRNHRRQGQPYGVWLAAIPAHVTEHASQVRQFITTAGVEPSAAVGARGRLQTLRDAVRGATDEEIANWVGIYGGYQAVIGVVVKAIPMAFEHEGVRIAASEPAVTVRCAPQDLLRLVAGEPARGDVSIEGDEKVLTRT
jgi:hypothetical protein